MRTDRDYTYPEEQIERVLKFILDKNIGRDGQVLWTANDYENPRMSGIPITSIHHIFDILESRGMISGLNKMTQHQNCPIRFTITGTGFDYYNQKCTKFEEIEKLRKETEWKYRITTAIAVVALIMDFLK